MTEDDGKQKVCREGMSSLHAVSIETITAEINSLALCALNPILCSFQIALRSRNLMPLSDEPIIS